MTSSTFWEPASSECFLCNSDLRIKGMSVVKQLSQKAYGDHRRHLRQRDSDLGTRRPRRFPPTQRGQPNGGPNVP